MSSMPVGGIRPASGPNAATPADVIVRNARVHTGDPARPAASAVAIRDGAFVAIGEDADVAPHVGETTRVFDALGRRVIPGLNDSHLHVIRGGLNYLLELRWDGVASLREALAMLREQAANTPKGQWVRVVGGWTGDQFVERRLPTIAEPQRGRARGPGLRPAPLPISPAQSSGARGRWLHEGDAESSRR